MTTKAPGVNPGPWPGEPVSPPTSPNDLNGCIGHNRPEGYWVAPYQRPGRFA